MITVVVSVDWEGRSLLPENLERVTAFRRRHPGIPLQHFLNAAYYTRPGIDTAATTRLIRQALLPQDECGLHIHAWHSLLAATGVSPRSTPRFLEDDAGIPKAPDDWGFYPPEGGYDVPLEHFDEEEIDRLIGTSVEILKSHGFGRPVSFRAGGWMAGPKVQAALVKQGFLVDSSAVDPNLSLRRFGDIPLSRWLRQLWPTIHETSQPYRVQTPQGGFWEIPNNAGLIDYTAVEALVEIVRSNIRQWRQTGGAACLISTGFHQETARKFLDALEEAIALMRSIAEEERVPLSFIARAEDVLNRISTQSRR